jgi:pimeloyl-ACP methyl ester carboxylesterase/DNA-binding CsgD family transcriptional regulator
VSDGVRFCTTNDRAQLGYSVFGSGRPLVVIPSWWMSPEADRRRLIGRDFWNDLPAGYRTISYDRRGIGVSTPDVGGISLASQVDDLQALTEHLKLTSFDLWTFGDAGAIGITFTARFPERVNRIVLYCPWSHTSPVAAKDPTGRAVAQDAIAALKALIRADWGMASRTFAEILYPKGPIEAQESSTKAIRETQTPEVALLYLDFCLTFDIRDELGKLALPVLVISREGPGRPPLVPVEASRSVASAIPGARFIAYDMAPATCPYFEYRMYHGAVCQFLADSGREMPLDATLSSREIEVLGLVAHGKTNAEIADLLVISKNTVDRHVSNILAKTGCANRAEAALYGARHRLVG